MTRSPSQRSLAPEYTRATTKRPSSGVPLPDHGSPNAYSQNPHHRHQRPQSGLHPPAYSPISHDSYSRHLHGDPYYRGYHPYPRPLQNPGYHVPHPPLPHPPPPPAPPSSYRPRDALPHRGRGSSRPSSTSTVKYYRSHAEYDSQRVHAGPHSSTRTRPPHSHEEEAPLSQSRPESQRRSWSESTGSRWGSEMPEDTPSPIDPGHIREWEEHRCRSGSYDSLGSGSGSYREDDGMEDGTECDMIDPALADTSRSHYSPSSHSYDARGSPMDDESLDGNRTRDPDLEPENARSILNSQKRPNSEYYPSLHHQAQFTSLKKQRGTGQQLQIGLNSLVDGEPGERPSYPIPTIIKCAILGSPHGQLTLSELYKAMEERFPYYRTTNKVSWKNSVRHNLSLNNQFTKKPRPMTEPGKGHYWVVIPDMPQGNKRERKRNKKPGKRALAAKAAEDARLARGLWTTLSAEDNDTNSDKNDADNVIVDKNDDNEVLNHSRSTAMPSVVAVTLPANAGSYAAVTGAIPVPAVDRQLFRPWHGDTTSSASSSSIRSESIHTVSSVSATPISATSDLAPSGSTLPSAENELSHDKEPANERPPSEESLPRPTVPRPPQGSSGNTKARGSGKKSSGRVQRSSRSRNTRLYAPAAVGPSPSTPQLNAFDTLVARIERGGITASGSGGPRSRTSRWLDPSRRRGSHDNSDSDGDLSGDENYLPNRLRRR